MIAEQINQCQTVVKSLCAIKNGMEPKTEVIDPRKCLIVMRGQLSKSQSVPSLFEDRNWCSSLNQRETIRWKIKKSGYKWHPHLKKIHKQSIATFERLH